MQVALISTDYPPLRTSAAVQMRDLAQEFLRQGHQPVVLVTAAGAAEPWTLETLDGVPVLRLAGPRTRDMSYLRRTIGELMLPFAMRRNLRKSPYRDTPWDIVAWYSPPIFFGPLVRALKRKSGAHGYLILRDIFPEWALDLGLLRKGLAYWFFKRVADYQYATADTIGVQTPSNLDYLREWDGKGGHRLEVLQNWQTPVPDTGSIIEISRTALAGRKVFVYIGNMGIAQGMDIFISLAQSLQARSDIGFLFVGRGSEVERLKGLVTQHQLTNTLFFNEVDSREMPGLLAQCHVGLLALDPRHKTHNIPGKFLTYLLAGLPILARVNAGTDLVRLIEGEDVGRVHVGDDAQVLRGFAEELADRVDAHQRMAANGRALGARMFSSETAVQQIVAAATDV